MKVYLIGMPASGKTTMGKKLAKQLNYAWQDLDKVLEQKYQTSIREIVEKESQEAFRIKEQNILHESFEYEKVVVSTGGGCPCFFDNLQVMKQQGLVIFLNTPLIQIVNRIEKSKQNRFMFDSDGKKEILHKIQNLYTTRKTYYRQAHWIWNL